jgi:thiol-disulfide isomerase/thioredoxin
MIDKAGTRKYLRAMKRLTIYLLFSVLALTFTLRLSGSAWAGEVQEANAGRCGENLDCKSLLVPGQVTVIEFYSPFCPPCIRIAPLMEQLSQSRPDLTIKKININRPEVTGIDWRSPLAQQYKLRSVPYFTIFNPQGKLVAEGNPALEQIERWLREAKILKE